MKRPFLQELHNVTSQNTASFIDTAMKISNLTGNVLFHSTPLFPLVCEKCKKSDRNLICFVETHTDYSQQCHILWT
jgi:hypothetical protein